MNEKSWVLFIMNEEDAEPKPVVIRPFTRFEMRRMEASVKILERYGVPARFDPVREAVISSWTATA